MSSQPVTYVSQEEYLERERIAETKHDYFDGEILDMAGGSLAHALIIMNVGGALRDRLKNSRCKAFSSDLRVCVKWGKLITYPDVTVACPPLEYADDKRDTITNPRLVVEVLSPGTRNYDRSEKLRMFRMAPSIEEYLLIDQNPVEIEHGRRMANGHWDVETILDGAAVIQLTSIDSQLPVAEIYEGLDILL